jgi:hypothetical protein
MCGEHAGVEPAGDLVLRRDVMPGSQAGKGGRRHGGAPFLKQLEEIGFRHVPELLRSRDF